MGMGRPAQRAALGVLLVAGGLAVAGPALGLTIFGIRLWGDPPAEEFEVIDPVPYTVTVAVATEREGLAEALRAASSLWADRETPASGRAGLIAKARGDYRRILAAAYNGGHYGAQISIRIAGLEASDITLAVPLPPEVPVEIVVDPGPRFRFGVAAIVNQPPWIDRRGRPVEEDPEAVGFAVGATARAAAVGAASELAIEQWRARSHAKAREADREIVADHATNRLEARLVLEPGPRARYGPTAVTGMRRVDPEFIAYMADLEEGDSFHPEDIATAQTRLVRLGTFRLVQIVEGDEIGPDGRLPMGVRVEERLQRAFGVGATLGTLDGLGLEGFWLHRNLRGRAEQLRFDANIARIGAETVPEDLTYQLGVTYVQPGVLNPDTNFVTSLVGRQQELDAYRETAVTFRFGLTRDFGPRLTGDIAFEIERSRVRDAFGVRRFLTFGPVARAQYDRRDDALDATAGYFVLAQAGPFYEAEFGNVAARGTLEGRVYRALDADARFVLAGRARVGSFVGPDAAESPPGQLFFAGGGGSVRGYAFRSIGVDTVFVDGEERVVGGRSLIETSAEMRARFGARFGVVGFLDGGFVAEGSSFSGDQSFRFGAGAGLRYHTGFGPIRVDVAAPLDRRPQDSAVALYIGIGQAF
jgi:translocation and assembly module TamA